MSRAKKYLTRVCAVALALMLLAGCAGNGGGNNSSTNQGANTPTEAPADTGNTGTEDTGDTSGDAAAQEPVTFTAFQNAALASSVKPFDTPVGQAIAEKTGVTLDIEYLVGTDARQKASLLIAGGTYPDLVFPGEATGEFITADVFIPLDDYIDQYGENIKAKYRPKELQLLKAQYGSTYYIPGSRASVDPLYPSAGYYLSIDLLKQANWPKPVTLDEWKQLVFDYCEANPVINDQKVIGYTGPTEAWRMSALQYGGARFLAGYPNDGPSHVDQESLEAKVIMTQDYYKDFLKMIWEFNQKGYLDPEMFQQTDDQFKAKLSSGSVAAFYEQRGNLTDPISYLEKNEMYDSMWIAFPVVLPGVDTERYYGPIGLNSQTGYAITNVCKDPERAFKFLDACAGEEITKLREWGIEGVDYTIEDGKHVLSEQQWANYMDEDYCKKQGIRQMRELPRMEDTFDTDYAVYSDGTPVSPAKTEAYLDLKYKDYEKEVLQAYNLTRMGDFFNPPYQARYEAGWAIRTKMPADFEGKIAVEQALETTTQYVPMLVLAKDEAEFNKKWDEFQQQLSGMALSEFEAEMNRMLKESSQYYQ